MSELFGGTGPLGSLTRRVTVLEGGKPSGIVGTSRDQRLDVLEAKLRGLEMRLAQVKSCSCSAKPCSCSRVTSTARPLKPRAKK